MPKGEKGRDIVVKRRSAYFDYEILETYEAGLVLVGSEVKSIREGRVSIEEAYAKVRRNGEIYVYKMNIEPYQGSPLGRFVPDRARKLLLHKREIKRLLGKTQIKGLTLIPLKLYFRNGFAKMSIALAKGKKLFDKRELIKRKEQERDIARYQKRKVS